MNSNQLVEKYLSLANKIAYQKKKSLPKFIDIDDIKSAAYMGLVEAANRYNSNWNIAFTTFAYPRIFGAIIDYLREMNKPALSLDKEPSFVNNLVSKTGDANDLLDLICYNLDERSCSIIKLYFVEEYSMKQTGKVFGISEGRISQLIKRLKKHCQKVIKTLN